VAQAVGIRGLPIEVEKKAGGGGAKSRLGALMGLASKNEIMGIVRLERSLKWGEKGQG